MTKYIFKIFLVLFLVIIFSGPVVVLAQKTPIKNPPATSTTKNPPATPTTKPPVKNPPATPITTGDTTDTWGCDALKAQIEENGGGRAAELPAYCSEGDVYKKIVFWLYFILGIGAVISIIYGGYIYMTAGSSESQTKKGKNIIAYTLAGVAVAVIATAIVTIIINLTVDNRIF